VIAESGGSRSLTVASGGSNPGALNLAAANSFTGGTILNGGVIRISNTQALGTGTFTVAALGGGISQNTGGSPLIGITNQVWSGNISMSATAGAINLGTSPVTVTPGSCTITLDNGSATVGGNISGAGASLTFRGTGYQGNFIFTGTNTFDGGLTLQPGTANTLTLNMYNASTIGTGPLTINQGSGQAVRFDNSSGVPVTLTYNNPQKWNNSSFSFVGTTNLNMGTGAVTLGTNVTLSANANTLTLGGAIGQVDATPRSLRKIGAGTLAIAGAGTYAGGTVVTNGTLSVEVGGVLGVGAVTVSPPGKIVLKHGEAIADDAAVTLTRIGTSYGKMDLIADVVERVGSVVLDGVTYSEPGTSFGAVGTGSTVESNNFFLGTGQLKITTSGTTTILIR
jgi:autotransporter-associated beta strand protein